ncbi:MAG: DNA mismatch repair endonuclease MutL [Tissierellia bacterium]|nr:DNA mismatch repair endonuclease MutL [Tissierellia bacterium]
MIKVLDKNTIKKIAAGEVIESPFSIVKELVENSIDAGANNIIVEIKSGGKKYIRVTDDGSGIKKDEILLAFKRHATSKIDKFDDLYSSFSMGFRGEALASILSCSDISIITKSKNEKIGSKIEFQNSEVINREDIATNTGTTIICKDIFSYIPVRRKFLSSDLSESNKITKLMYILAIGNSNISFKYIKDQREIFRTYSNLSLVDNMAELLDKSYADELIEINEDYKKVKIKGYISTSNYYRGNRSLQYLYVNKRYVENDAINARIEKLYNNLIPNNRFPAYQLFIEVDPSEIDINIHPNKRKIKFSYEDEVLDFIEKSIAKKLFYSDKKREIKSPNKKNEDIFYNDSYNEILDLMNPQVSSEFMANETNEDYVYDENNKSLSKTLKSGEQMNYLEEENSSINKNVLKSDDKDNDEKNQINRFKDYTYRCSFFSRYSLFEKEDSLLVLDHRIADEKIKFEKYKKDFKNNTVNSQILLKPYEISLKNNEMTEFKENFEIIKKLGFDADIFSEGSIMIRAIPIFFDQPENLDFFYQILDAASDIDAYFDKKISRIIKSYAFRKGDKINCEQATSLLNELNNFKDCFKTYDGRNTIVFIKKNEMEKFFER